MDHKAINVRLCPHVDHSSWRLDIYESSKSFQSSGVFSIHGQHITRHVLYDKDDKLYHDHRDHIVS